MAGLVVLAGCGLTLLGLSYARVGLVAELVGVAGALLPVGPVVAAFLWVDRWEPEPARLLWLAFAWGACVAAITALLINNTAEAVGDLLLGKGQGDKISAMVSAPLFEEGVKGAFVLGILLFLREEFDGVVDGIVYAGLVAAGFAFTENIYYFGRAFAEYGFGDSTSPGVLAAFILRGVLSPFTHPLFTVMIGIGVGIAARSTSKRTRLFAPLLGYLAAVVLHALWNTTATLGNADTFLSVYFLVMVPVFGAVVYFVHWQRKREQRVVSDGLPAMVDAGLIVLSEVDLLASLKGRKRWRAQVRSQAGGAAAQAVERYQGAVSELAFHWHAMAVGTAGPRAAEREARLIGIVRESRRVAVDVARATR
ncbi:PrsW family intramembrane metalloprotease [Actinokineospora globicatena]|uniref:PrsW family intramembrane metalloprotease n=1 Tax=Actinokineospora globicatena TaxID=103729 RepID=UPI0020A5FD55|nr:PrsW family intramembrane metalloprotease [Actinokineospora globicatena]MCP2300915.1 Membrane proteinase PrsW, cleaves anti-sigma factor RsiW, M82 family [Actinokineospora globicatena]GLW77458.1 membrane protein [Actinokineospora globicatena]GLW84292.1 membrane protein [Actinokineospora globicatena]